MSRTVRYRVLRKLAHGGMAEIFLASQIGAEGFEKPVVLKRILPALAADPAFVRMIVDEAHIASSLNHSHLVQVLDLGQAGGQFFLVLEFVDGWSLEEVRKRARKARLKLPLPLALYVTSALCRGLDYVHRRTRNGKPLGIVHRDVTPQNVLLSREGEVKLADFGIAKAVGRREKSATGVIKGKFAYMSPEQAAGGELDARSDLFSVGTMLYVLTTGKKPFEAATDLELLVQVRKGRYEKPSEVVRDFNPDVERFIARALRTDRAKRWQSAEHMADRLDALLARLAQPNGPAVLKRWLETLSSRDGVPAPSEVPAAATEGAPGGPTGTIDLVSGDFQLTEASDEDSSGTGWAPTERARLGAAGARPGDFRATGGGVRGGIGDSSKAAYEAVEISAAGATPGSTPASTPAPAPASASASGPPAASAPSSAPATRQPEPPPPPPPAAETEPRAPRSVVLRRDAPSTAHRARGPESTLGRWLRRATMTLFLSVGLVCGAYLARPYLPPWAVPPWLVHSIESWLGKLAVPAGTPAAPVK